MPSDHCNYDNGTKAMHLIFSLFDVASAREVTFGMPQYIQCILHGLTSALFCVLLTGKSINSVVARDIFLFVTENFCIFHTGYFDHTVKYFSIRTYW